MNTRTALLIYTGLLGVLMILLVAGYKKNRRYFENLNRKDNPLYFLYPAAAFLYSGLKKTNAFKPGRALAVKLRQLYTKENIAEELYLYSVKKIAVVLGVLTAASVLGLMMCISNMNAVKLNELKRNEFGKGEALYELDVSYEGKREDIEVSIDEVKYTEDEAIAIMDKSIDEIKKEMLGENKDLEHISKPLDLVAAYDDIEIYWEIEDTDIVDYNGMPKEVKENENTLVNLYATLSLNDTEKMYVIPVVVVCKEMSEKEELISNIMESIDKNNSIYDENVTLPENINGNPISFRKPGEDNGYIFLILGILGAIVIALGYEKQLDKRIIKRNEQMLDDLPDIVSRLGLLYEAGLSIYRSFEKIVSDHDQRKDKEEHFAYNEMKITLEKIKNGMSEREAYAEFGKRCGLHPYVRLGNMLEQNLMKGTKGMKEMLKAEVEAAFEEKKKTAKKRGEEASTKLLFPMVIMLLIVIVIIAVPALMTIQL